MKNLIYVFILISINLFSQEKKIIFLFDENKDIMLDRKGSEIYAINKKYTFKYDSEKNEKIQVKYDSIKSNILITYSQFIKLNKRKKYPDYFNEYSFYIFIDEKDENGCLIEVEKIWLVEDNIID